MHRHVTFRVKILVLRHPGIFSRGRRLYCVREDGLNDCNLLLRKHEIFLKFFEAVLSVSYLFLCSFSVDWFTCWHRCNTDSGPQVLFPVKEWMFCTYDLALKTLRNIYGVIYN